jgi:hypothetical protein
MVGWFETQRCNVGDYGRRKFGISGKSPDGLSGKIRKNEYWE